MDDERLKNPGAPNMALTTWSGSRVRKHDVIVAKITNYELRIKAPPGASGSKAE